MQAITVDNNDKSSSVEEDDEEFADGALVEAASTVASTSVMPTNLGSH